MRVDHEIGIEAPSESVWAVTVDIKSRETRCRRCRWNLLLRRMKVKNATVHGFRTDFPREIAEAALAPKVGNNVEQACRRGDALEKRRRLMESVSRQSTSGAAAATLRKNGVNCAIPALAKGR